MLQLCVFRGRNTEIDFGNLLMAVGRVQLDHPCPYRNCSRCVMTSSIRASRDNAKVNFLRTKVTKCNNINHDVYKKMCLQFQQLIICKISCFIVTSYLNLAMRLRSARKCPMSSESTILNTSDSIAYTVALPVSIMPLILTNLLIFAVLIENSCLILGVWNTKDYQKREHTLIKPYSGDSNNQNLRSSDNNA